MTDTIRIQIMIPFCEEESIFCELGAVPKQKTEIREKYMQALVREITVSAKDHERQRVRSIHVTGGVISSVEGRSLDVLLTLMEQLYRITPETELVLDAMPGEVNIPTVRGCQKHNVTALNLMVFSSDARVRIPAGLSPETDGVELTDYVMFSVGWQHRCITLMPGMPGSTEITWRKTLGQMSVWHPEWVRLLPYPEGEPDAISRELELASLHLKSGGYEEVNGVYSRNGRGILCFAPGSDLAEEVGFGLGARSVMEGISCRNTQSLTRYLLYSDQPDKILYRD